jgi:hypothetical protein
MDKVTIETAIRWHRESIRDLEAILEEDVPFSIYGYRDEAQVKAEIALYESKVTELKEKLKDQVSNG